MPFAYALIKEINPSIFVELGTHYGDSYFTFCQARKDFSLKTKCYAIDHWKGDIHSSFYNEVVYDTVVQYNSANYSDFSKLIRSNFNDALPLFKDESIDLLHIDGLHTYEAIVEDFRNWIHKVKDKGIILLHDICVKERGFGVYKFWKEIQKEYCTYSLNFEYGLGIIKKVAKPSTKIQIEGSLLFNKSIDEMIELQGIKTKYKNQCFNLIKRVSIIEKKNILLNNRFTKTITNLEKKHDALQEKLSSEVQKNFLLSNKLKILDNKKDNLLHKIIKILSNSKRRPFKINWIKPCFISFSSYAVAEFQGTIECEFQHTIIGIYIKLGSRKIKCEFNLRNDMTNRYYNFYCHAKFGTGLKKCKLIVVLSDYSEFSLSNRMLFCTKFRNQYVSSKNSFCAHPMDPFSCWLSFNTFTNRNRLHYEIIEEKAPSQVLFSLIVPTYNPNLIYLKDAISSILNQTYSNWEICIVDDGSYDTQAFNYLKSLSRNNPKVKLHFSDTNGGIAKATNTAISLASGEFLIFLDQDDVLASNALSEFSNFISSNPHTDFIYSDDDKIDINGRRYSPQFKPDWSPELLLSYCYVSHAKAVRKSKSVEIGNFRDGFEGSQDYDYILRLSEVCRNIGHIPKILYHWRAVPGSTAMRGDSKPNSFKAGEKAVQETFDRRGIPARVTHPIWAKKEFLGIFEPIFPDDGPEVTIIIPTRNNYELLDNCLKSLKKTTYENFKIIIINNDSDEEKTISYLSGLSNKVLNLKSTNGKFNFSNLVNVGVKHASSPYILLLNDDTEVISPRWLSQMVGFLGIKGVGCVGAKLLFPNNNIQHAGIVHGITNGFAGTAFRNEPSNFPGYLNYLRVARNYSAITAACLLTSKKIFEEVGGFDEENFAIAYNDVDFCYRVVNLGKRCVYCPDAVLYHREGSSRGHKDQLSELVAFKQKYHSFKDNYYNPNLSLANERFEIKAVRLTPPYTQNVRMIAVTHNLNYEGAPLSMFEMLSEVKKSSSFHIQVISLQQGPLQNDYEDRGINVKIVPFPANINSKEEFNHHANNWARIVEIEDYNLVYANTLDTYFAIIISKQSGIPCVWNIRESTGSSSLFPLLSPSVSSIAYECFQYPYRIIFVASATRKLYENLNSKRNFSVIKNAINTSRFSKDSVTEIKTIHDIPLLDKLVLCVGTICKRKGQHDLIKAFLNLPAEVQKSTSLVFIGNGTGKYFKRILKIVESSPILRKKVFFVGVQSNIDKWYRAAYLYACPSKEESYPRVILEAMHFSLPILTTPIYGIAEQVIEHENALFFSPGNVAELSNNLLSILKDESLRNKLSNGSKEVIKLNSSFEFMVENYKRVFLEASDTA